MRIRTQILIAVCLALVCGCDEERYTITMEPDSGAIKRTITCSENVGDATRQRLKQAYQKQLDKDTFEGTFSEILPDDIGGFARYLHLENPMGQAALYVERFGGSDAQAPDIEKAFQTVDVAARLLIDWLEFELGDDPNFENLHTFCTTNVKQDAKNLIVYIWMAARIPQQSETEAAMRALLYLYERGYFTFGDIARLAASPDSEELVLRLVREFVARKLGRPDPARAADEFEFLKDPNSVEASLLRFVSSPPVYDRFLAEARRREADPNLVIEPNEIPDKVLEWYGISLETFFLDFEIFGGPDAVDVTLACPRKPHETNGTWDQASGRVTWSGPVTDDDLPFLCYASVAEPNERFQKSRFGAVILQDEQLLQYAFWYRGLTDRQRDRWDEFLSSLKPSPDLRSRVDAFRFEDANSPDQPDAVSDLARSLITQALDSTAPAEPNTPAPPAADKADPAHQDQSKGLNKTMFMLEPIGKVVKQDDRTFIEIDEKFRPGLKGLERHSYVHVVYWFDKNDTPQKRAILQVHPRGDARNPLTGVFATHSPFRPNLIAISRCDIISIEAGRIEIKDIDAFDGSPVIDLKGDFFAFHKPDTP